MRWDYAIGNPPFQDGDSEASRKPSVYNYFMDAVYQVAEKVELITPGRFLFEAGQTPKEWNRKMLNDEHLKVLYYESDSSKVFPSVQLKGGVSITYVRCAALCKRWDAEREAGRIVWVKQYRNITKPPSG